MYFQGIGSIDQNQQRKSSSKLGPKRQDLNTKKVKTFIRCLKIPTKYSKTIIVSDTVGFFLNIFIMFVVIVPLPFVLISFATQLDSFYFVFEQLLLPHPYYRSTKLVVLVNLTRITLMFFCTVEFLRFAAFTAIGVMILVFAIVSISQKLVYVFDEKCLLLFVQLRLILAVIQNLSSLFTGVAIFGSQFVLSVLLWVAFKCYNILSIYLYIVACCLAGFLITFISLMLPAISTLHTETVKLIKRKRTLFHCISQKGSRKYYYYSLWKSHQSLYFRCSTFFIVNRKATALYSKELINNLLNAVLLIDPKIV